MKKPPHRQHPQTPRSAIPVTFNKKPLSKQRKATWQTYIWYVVLAVLGSILIFSATIFVYILWILKDLPSPEELANYSLVSTTKIYARDGSLLYEAGNEGQRRTVVPYDQISRHMINATLAAEDDEFFTHPGFDWKGILRAVYSDTVGKLFGEKGIQGGSTITQQFVKNAFLTPERTLRRKISELILSVELEQNFSKEKILELYLNKIFYGSQSYGVQAAAKTYFNKDAKNLTIAESAALASIPQSPTRFSPYNNKDTLLSRQKYILDRMYKLNMLNDGEYNKASKDELAFAPYKATIRAPHFVFYVMQELEKNFGTDLQGLNIHTTLDPTLQEEAEKIVKEGALKNEKSHGAANAGLVSLDPKTGEILVMVGSRDYFDDSVDGKVNIITSKRQPGSSFKPLTYATLFTKGFGTGTVFYDVETDFGNKYIPADYDGKHRGPVTVRYALANSLNIPAVAAQYLARLDDTLTLINKLGIEYLDKTAADRNGLALALGVEEIAPIDMAEAYSVFANNGKKVPVAAISKITNDQQKVLWERTTPVAEEVLDPQAAYLINNILSDNNARPAHWVNLFVPDHTVAVKTGTSINIVNNVKKPKDLWTIGYTTNIVTAVWVGNNKGEISALTADGVTNAASIWKPFMVKALAGKANEEFPRPDKIKEVAVSTLSGFLPSRATPPDKIRTELFPDYGVPTTYDQGFASARVDQISGKLATEYCSENVALYVYQNFHSILYYLRPDDPALPRWEEAVQKWAYGVRNSPVPTPTSNPVEGGPPTTPIVYVDSPDKIPTEPCNVIQAHEMGITLLKPGEGDKVRIGLNKATFSINDPYEISKITAYFDGQISAMQESPPFDSMFINVPESPLGSIHTVRFVFELRDGKQVSVHAGIVVSDDATPPEINILEPRENQIFTPGEVFQINAIIVDDKAISRAEFFFDGSPIITLENSPYITSFMIPIDTTEGFHELLVRAYDSQDNVTRFKRSIEVKNPNIEEISSSDRDRRERRNEINL